MSLKHVLTVLDTVDSPQASGQAVVDLFSGYDGIDAHYERVTGDNGSTDFIKIVIPGTDGKISGGSAPTLGIIGRLGGLGARPARIGYVSDGDGAVTSIAAGLKLAEMHSRGDKLPGDIICTTHVCPDAPTVPHKPVEFMGSPVGIHVMNQHEVLAEMDAILSVDTTKGNQIVNHKGIAISAPVLQGYILKFSDDLIRIVQTVTGQPAVGLPISIQDITAYGNGVHHINSIMQPVVASDAPVVGVAITAASAVPGSATGASHETDIADAVRFVIEVGKEFGHGTASFVDEDEFGHLVDLYGSLKHLTAPPQE